MMAQNERTLRMKEEYVSLHSQGMSPVEIAAHFGLSKITVYRYLGEIAEKAGVTRESLLEMPQMSNLGRTGMTFGTLESLDLSGFRKHSAAASSEMAKTNQEIARFLDAQEENLKIFEGFKEGFSK